MKKNTIKAAAFLSTVAMCLTPMTSAISASAANDVFYGDANLDGKVSIADATMIEWYLEDGYAIKPQGLINADVNKDGVVNKVDANLITKRVNGSLDSFDYNFGDINEDGTIDEDDLSAYYKLFSLNLEVPTERQKILADVDGNDVVDDYDSLCLYDYIQKEPHQFVEFDPYSGGSYVDPDMEADYIIGDANCDGKITNADAVAIEGYLQEKFTLCNQGLINADVNKDGTVNQIDANLIRKLDKGSLDSFDYNFGDVNQDGVIDVDDTVLLCSFLAYQTPNEVQTILSDVNGDDELTINDLDCLAYYLRYEPHQFRYLETYTYDDDEVVEEPEYTPISGDTNLDGKVSIADATMIEDYLKDAERYAIKPQGLINADVNKDGIVNQIDANLIRKLDKGSLDSFDYNFGDINFDVRIDAVDVLCLKGYLAFPFGASKTTKIVADVNGDGKINYSDVNCLRRYIRSNPHQFTL